MATSNSPTGPFPPATSTPTKPLAQRLQESYFSGRTPSKEELLGFQDMLSTMQSLPESEVERVFNTAKANNYDMAGRLGADYYQNKLTQQLTNQRNNLDTGKYYKGSIDAMGGIDTATQYMASLLARSGIRDLSEIKEVTETQPVYGFPSDIPFKREEDGSPKIVRPETGGQFYEVVVGPNPEGGEYTHLVPVDQIPQVQTGANTYTKLVNSRTGEQLKQGHDASYIYASTQNAYVDGKPDSDYTIGGSFAGGNTSLKVRMVNGVPMFYSAPGPSSSDFPKEAVAFGLAMASLAVPTLGAAIGSSITGALGITASTAVNAAIGSGVLTTIASGGDIKKGVISGVTSFVAPAIASEIGKAAGQIFDSPMGQKMFTNMSAAALRTAALGGNSDEIEKAILGTATGEMFNVVTSQIPGFGDIKDPALKASVSQAVQAALSTPGDLSDKAQAAMLQGSITMGLSNLEIDGKKFTELSPAQQSIAKQIFTTALSGQPLNDQALLKTALSAAEGEVKSAIRKGEAPQDLAAYDASVGLTAPGTSSVPPTAEATVPGAAPEDTVLAADDFNIPGLADAQQMAGPMGPFPPSFVTRSGGIESLFRPGEEIFGREYTAPAYGEFGPSMGEYASAGTSDVPARDISISKLPETMRPREGETVTDATYGSEGEVRVTMVGKRPDGTEYSYTAVQDPEDQSVFYETAGGGETGGSTLSSNRRPEIETKSEVDKFIDNITKSTDLSGETNVDDLNDAAEIIAGEMAGLSEADTEAIERAVNAALEAHPSLTQEDITNIVSGQLTKLDIPTDANIKQVVGEAISSADLTTKANVTDAINTALAGLDFATENEVKLAIKAALDADPNLTQEQVTNIVSGELNKLNIPTNADISSAVKTELGKLDFATDTEVSEIVSRELAGLDFATAEDVQNAIASALEANPNLTTEQVTNIVSSELNKLAIPTATDISSAVKAEIGKLDFATDTEISEIVSRELAGLDFADAEAVQAAIDAALEANPSLTQEQVTNIVSGELNKLDIPTDADIGSVVKTELGKLDFATDTEVSEIVSRELAGLDFADEEDVKRAIEAALDANPSLTSEQVSGLIKTALETNNVATDTDIENLSDEIADIQSEISGLGLEYADKLSTAVNTITGKVAEYESAGLTRDAALKQSITDLADELGDTEEGLLAKLGTTETKLKDALESGLSGVTTKFGEELGGLKTDLLSRISAFESAGLTRDQATQASISELADELGETEEGLLAKLGTTEANLKSELESGLAGVTTKFGEELGGLKSDLLDRIKTFEDAGLTRDEATQKSLAELADELGDTEAGLLEKLGTTETQLKSDIAGVETRLGTQIGDLQSQLAGQGLEYANKLSTAVDTINDRMTAFEGAGATRDEALQAAIDSLADELGTSSQSLLDQLNLNKTELQEQIEKANLDYAKQVAGLTTDITGVKTGLETLGTKVGEQVGGLGTKVAGIEQTLAKQPEQWAKLFSDLQTGFGTQISGLQSQLARQNAQQKAAQEAAQQAAMAPKFETFYANIPGYKPFDIREFSSALYDEE